MHIGRIMLAMAATPSAHATTLFGERKAGSRWGRDFTQSDWEVLLPRWQEFTPAEGVGMPGCSYFACSIGDLFPDATLGAVGWDSLSPLIQDLVQERSGDHGYELVLPVSPLAGYPRAVMATLILGPNAGHEVVFTVHPGAPLRPGVERSGMTAVKVVVRER